MIFQLNLQRTTTVRIARMVMEQAIMKEKIMICSLLMWEESDVVREYYPHSELNHIIAPSLELVDNYILPRALISELKAAIQSMAIKTFYWFQYVCELYEYNWSKAVSCMKTICWNHYGGIDYRRTFELSWLGNKELNKHDIFVMACNYCFEDHIRSHWEPTSDNNDQPIPLTCSLAMYWQAYLDENFEACKAHLLSVCQRSCVIQLLGPNMEWYNNEWTEPVPLVAFLLALSVWQGHSEALKYFWCRLSTEQKKKYFFPIISGLLQCFGYWYWDGYAYSYMYLLQQLMAGDCVDFIVADGQCSVAPEEIHNLHSIHVLVNCDSFINEMSYCTLFLSSFLCLWPWQECIVPVLQQLWRFPELWSRGPEGLDIANLLGGIRDATYTYDRQKVTWIERIPQLHHIWHITPTKIKLLSHSTTLNRLICTLLTDRDVKTVKAIINDEDLASMRDGLVLSATRQYMRENEDVDFELIDQFLSFATTSALARRTIKRKISMWGCLVDRDNMCKFIDGFLKWQNDASIEYFYDRSRMKATTFWQRLVKREKDETHVQMVKHWGW